MQQICEFRSNFENISRDRRTVVERLSYDSRKTFLRVSHNVPTNVNLVSFSFVRQSLDICESVAQHSYECHLVLLSRQIVASCLHVFSRLSHNCHTTFVQVSQKFLHCKFAKISQRQVCDTCTNFEQLSCSNCGTTVAQPSCDIFY